jgi:hypothetical protein
MSRASDAVVIVISEEDGRISCALDGQLERGIDEEKLINILRDYFTGFKKKKSTKNVNKKTK